MIIDSCKGCDYQIDDNISIKRFGASHIPEICYSCYDWDIINSERKNYKVIKKAHFDCVGCVYQMSDGRPGIRADGYKSIPYEEVLKVCDNCYTWSRPRDYRSNYEKKLFSKDEIDEIFNGMDNMSEEKKYSCKGCMYQYKNYTYISKAHGFEPPLQCYSCYVWALNHKQRRLWKSGKRVHFSCDGCLYEKKNVPDICEECCSSVDFEAYRKNWKSSLFINDIENIMKSIDEI